MEKERLDAVRIASILKNLAQIFEVVVFIGIAVLLFFVTPVFFFAENVHASAPGLLGFLMKVFNTGHEAVTAKDVYIAFLPDFSKLFTMIPILELSKRLFKSVCDEKKLFFPGADKRMLQICIAWLVFDGLPVILNVALRLNNAERVNTAFFGLLLFISFMFRYGERLENTEEKKENENESDNL